MKKVPLFLIIKDGGTFLCFNSVIKIKNSDFMLLVFRLVIAFNGKAKESF